MKTYLRISIVATLLAVALAVATIKTHSASFTDPESLTVAAAQSDFDLMRKALEEAHTGLYRYLTKQQMDRVFDAQRAKINKPMSKFEFVAILAETVAGIRCGHTGVSLDADTQKEVGALRTLPLKISIEGKRFIVLSNDTADDKTIRPGMEVTEINGRKPAEILDRILPKITTDGDIDVGKYWRAQQSLPSLFWSYVDNAQEFSIRARDEHGKVVTARLNGVTTTERTDNRKNNPVNFDLKNTLEKLQWWTGNLGLRFLEDPAIAEIHISGFGGNDYPAWMENTFKTLKEKGTKTLIIDLRSNGGGADMYGAMLVSYLTDKPFRYFDHINVKTISPSFKEFSDWKADREPRLREDMTPNPAGGYLVPPKLHPGVAEQQPGKYPFTGKVFVLIDGGTFSTAADFCAVTHHLKRATFIGEETGGGYYGNNSGMQTIVTLPNSKARVRVPMYEYWNAVPGYEGKRRGTIPDHKVETKIANLLRGVDEQLEMALKLAK